MTPHAKRPLYSIASLVLASILICGFAIAYGAGGAGLLGLLQAKQVSLLTLFGAGISFVGLVGYFLVGTAHLRAARLSGLNDFRNSQ
jgi:hypothetical protein